ncbi:PRC-barrel domain-containing protein [Aquisalinus flavus]|uniref:PRC-barrel domain-containing protein n=1 Tax=Aquisalinus flavus TaxID=1526572 RepID=A0A8J2V3Y3_9PROT|nr:PRC-barrel domain-containing protein [Aquisalinus flavus]MBD0426820.1 PRC-barrel domain-containing protein [Aquisalinus flavus]UNE46668.1 hypothetical protein FF099_00650 [Aquisalinus flavus]GGC96260.1 hypothetical protein GCM10011342_01330 [Aquisalinus flavus]
MADIHENLTPLGDLGNYKLENEDQDIRGLPLVSPDGRTLGKIEDMLVDKEDKRVAAIRLDQGLTVPVDGLEIQDDQVIDHGAKGAHAAGDRAYSGRAVER